MSSDAIVMAARGHLAAWRQISFPAEIVPSELWSNHIREYLDPIIQGLGADAVVERVTGENVTSGPMYVSDPQFKNVFTSQQRWLERFGRPLRSFPSFVQDSTLSDARVAAEADGRRLSTAFLYHLSTAVQLQKTVAKLDRVFELGSGYGGFARVLKLLSPGTRMVMCDLPETLYLCYVFLRRHFPNCSFVAVESREQLAAGLPDADFTFVPAQLATALAGASFDVAVNTCSLSEMTQPAANYYLDLIENQLKADYFFHVNRFASPEKIGNVCATSFGLDPHWEVLQWQWHGEDNFFNAYFPQYQYILTVMLQRIPEAIRSDVLHAGRLARLRARLPGTKPGTDEWHALMWDLIRIGRNRADIEAYLRVIRPAGFRETAYYEGLLAKAA